MTKKNEINPLPDSEIDLQKEKYWIKNGIAVQHIDYPEIKMRVQDVKKIRKKIHDGKGGMTDRTFVVGVLVTWLDKKGEFQKGVFSTRELKPYKED